MNALSLLLALQVFLSVHSVSRAQTSEDPPFIVVEDDLPVCEQQQFVTFNGTHLFCRNMSEHRSRAVYV